MASAIASPMARPAARIVPATRAGRIDGIEIRIAARHESVPSAREPSRHASGTLSSASTKIATMIGMTITARIEIPQRSDVPVRGSPAAP